ncbi:hypothetical protein [Apibacter sp.]|nr:hypothetical protein [Apibacter sp.]MCT6870164.1 hypothetical protein [Apibacter sp.]
MEALWKVLEKSMRTQLKHKKIEREIKEEFFWLGVIIKPERKTMSLECT